MNRLCAALLGATLLAMPAAAMAGSDCSERSIGPAEMRNAVNMAHKTLKWLEASDAQVALIGRVGSDISEQGLRYTHMGAAVREHPKGRWLFVHLLNVCANDSSDIFDEGLINFFLDDLFAFEAAILIPEPQLQARLKEELLGPLVRTLHNPQYSMIANPFSTKYQNSNQWVLELTAVAMAPKGSITTRAQAQAMLTLKSYQPDSVKVSPVQQLGASLFRANVRFDDHTADEAAAGRYNVVTVRSVVRFLQANGLATKAVVLPLEGAERPADNL